MAERLKRWVIFLALFFAAMALGPALAHLFALPNKVELPEAQYFVAQSVYRGWALLGIVVFGALLSTLALSIVLRDERRPMMWAVLAFLCIAGARRRSSGRGPTRRTRRRTTGRRCRRTGKRCAPNGNTRTRQAPF